MDKKSKTIVYILSIIGIIGLIYLAYLIDSNKIASYAEVEPTTLAKDLKKLPSPDQSIVTEISTYILDKVELVFGIFND